MIVSVSFHHMTMGKYRLDCFGKTLGDGPAGQERRLDVLFLQNPQQPINCMVRSVFALAPHFVIENAVLVRLHVLAALEVEGQKDCGSLAARPTHEMIVVVFLEHESFPLREAGLMMDAVKNSSLRSRTAGAARMGCMRAAGGPRAASIRAKSRTRRARP